jgi:hypothetical protein
MGNKTPTSLTFRLIETKIEAQQLLDGAEKLDFYLSECHDDRSNSYARRSLTYVANTMSMLDTRFCTVTLDTLKTQLPKRLIDELGEIRIIQLMPSADGGMPHTRPYNIVCYPDISQVASINTLTHELWHVHQRNFQELWTKVFNKLGWKAWNTRLPIHLESNRRYNPDTIDTPLWVFKETWLPLPIFNDISLPKIKETSMWFYNVKTELISKKIPVEISEYFPNLPMSAYEHPRELTAYMLSDPDSQKDSQGYADLIESIGYISVLDI